MKRVIAFSDMHCGGLIGLTPQAHWQGLKKESKDNPDITKHNKFARLQRALWREFDNLLEKLAPYDVGLFCGDAIDGKGSRSGGTELITTDRNEQVDMAKECIHHVRLKCKRRSLKLAGVYGTPYHTGEAEDWEAMLIKDCGFETFGSHEWPEVNGCVFDIKHKIGSSGIPHGRGTAVLRDMLWNDLWSMSDQQPRADIVLRGHAHYYMGLDTADKMGFVLPALCGMGSKFGARACSGIVHWGMMHFDINDAGEVVDWQKHLTVIEEQKAKTTVL